jgi:Zn-dependent oligopeptidase
MVNVTWHYITVMDNAKSEETRKKLLIEHDNLARAENIPLMEKILPLRDDIARKLGYKSWADYRTEVKMVKNAATAIDFLEKLKTGLQTKFDAELNDFRKLKVKETGDANAKINIWDWRYFSNQLKKEKYTVDAEQLRVFFPYQRVLDGMFSIYQKIFGLKFESIDAPYNGLATSNCMPFPIPKPANRSASSTSTCSPAKANTTTLLNSASSKASCSPMVNINAPPSL